MKFLMAALVLTLAVAITAAVFAIWPVVADAPWEDANPTNQAANTTTIRCEGALKFRDTVIAAGQYSLGSSRRGVDAVQGNPSGLIDYTAQLSKAEREIATYC